MQLNSSLDTFRSGVIHTDKAIPSDVSGRLSIYPLRILLFQLHAPPITRMKGFLNSSQLTRFISRRQSMPFLNTRGDPVRLFLVSCSHIRSDRNSFCLLSPCVRQNYGLHCHYPLRKPAWMHRLTFTCSRNNIHQIGRSHQKPHQSSNLAKFIQIAPTAWPERRGFPSQAHAI